MAKASKAAVAQSRPAWVEQLLLKFSASVAHTFIISGNVRDVVDTRNSIESYLTKLFSVASSSTPGGPKYDLVIFYDRANGLRFPLQSMEDKFMELLSLKNNAATKSAASTQAARVFGATGGPPKTHIPKEPRSCFQLVEQLLKAERADKAGGQEAPLRTVFIVDYAESIFPAGEWSSLSTEDRDCIVCLLNWSKDAAISRNANPIILITDSATRLHDSITSSASRVEMIEIKLPSPAEREEFIRFVDEAVKEQGAKGLEYAEDFSQRKFANLTAGLRKNNIEDIKLQAEAQGQAISAELVKRRKGEIFKQEYSEQLEVIDADEFGFEAIGGYDWLKDYHRLDVIAPMLRGDVRRTPQGLLYLGPPGTGKSVFARALAKESRMNMVRLDVGKLMSKYVGSSEHNMARALFAIYSLVPVIVFIDEIDQAATRGSHGDSGVSDRMFKALLESMSDTTRRGQVLWIAATNRPDAMDAALKRTGRFDKKIAFLPPDEAQRREIFQAVLLRYGIQTTGLVNLEELARLTRGWVGSDVEAAIIKAYTMAGRENREQIKQADLLHAVQTIIPSTAETELWSTLALLESNDVDLLPPTLRENFQQQRLQLQQQARAMQNDSITLRQEEHLRSIRQM